MTVFATGGTGGEPEVQFPRTGQASIAALLAMLRSGDGASIERIDPTIGATDTPDRRLRYRPGAALARTVRLRDGTCRHPGCTVPADYCDLDHLIPFDHSDPATGGHTEECNLGCFCRRHHRFKHSSGWHYTMDPDGTLHWSRPKAGYYDEQYLPKKLTKVGEDGSLYFDDGIFPWKLADDFTEDPRWGYPKWKVALGKLTGKGRK